MKKKKIFLFIFATILVLDMALFLVPSLLTIFSSNKLFYGAKMLYSFSNFDQYNKADYINNGLCFATFILIIILSYVGIIFILKKDTIKENTRNVKARRKEENSSIEINIKSKVHSNFIFALFLILIISVISIFILPNNSGDVYYYIATGRMGSLYKLNPYNVTLDEAKSMYPNDPVISNCYDYDSLYAYGVIWYLISKILACVPTQSNALLLLNFKIVNVIVHFVNCYLIFKLSLIHQIEKNNDPSLVKKIRNNKFKIKEVFNIFDPSQINKAVINTLIYALNPLIIEDLLINCHNDVFLICSILLAFYLKKRDKVNLAVLSLTFGGLIKYLPLMFLPYILNNNKSKFRNILYFVGAIALFFGLTFLVTGSSKNTMAFLTQASKLSASFYLCLSYFLGMDFKVTFFLANCGKAIFLILYFAVLLNFYIKEKKKNEKVLESDKMRTYTILVFIFIVLTLSCIRAWYFTWLFVFVPFFDLDSNKSKMLFIIDVSIAEILSIFTMYFFGEGYPVTAFGFNLFVLTLLIFYTLHKLNKKLCNPLTI